MDGHLAIMPLLDEAMDRSIREDFRVTNDGRAVHQVATEVPRISWADALGQR